MEGARANENNEGLVIVIKLEFENEREHSSGETLDSRVLLPLEAENPPQEATKVLVLAEGQQIVTNKLQNSELVSKLNDSEENVVIHNEELAKSSARVIFVDESSPSGIIFDHIPKSSTSFSGTSDIRGNNNSKYYCEKCGKDFPNKWMHIDDKHPEVRNPRPLPCKFCNDIFTIKPRLVSHMEKVHGKAYGNVARQREKNKDENFAVCGWCGKEYKGERTLRNHERLLTGEKPYSCNLCGNTFVLKTRLDTHVRSHNKLTILDTPVVPDAIPLSKEISKENNVDSRKRKMTKNGKAEQRPSNADGVQTGNDKLPEIIQEAHIRDPSNSDKKLFRCCHKDCGKSFVTMWKLKVHARIHTGQLLYTCDWEGCGKKLSLSDHWKRHLRTHTGEKPHICNVCQKQLSRADHLIKHMRIQHQKQPYACDHEGCSEEFKTYAMLKTHFKIHIGEPPYVCDYENCGKYFQIYQALKGHMKTHTCPHSCCYEGCDKSFATKWKLTDHVKTHTGEKPYNCYEGCDKSFATKWKLTRHIRTHTGEKPYVCKQCSKRFSRSEHLKKHMTSCGAV